MPPPRLGIFRLGYLLDSLSVVARFTLTSAPVIVAASAMIVARFTLAASDRGLAAFVIAALAVPTVIVPTFALTAHEGGLAAFVITAFVTSTTTVIAAAVESYVLIAVPANHLAGALSSRDSAARDALMDGPVIHAPAATAHAHAGRSPAARLAVAAGEKSKPGRDDRHSRAHN